jgi:hypothetical protein
MSSAITCPTCGTEHPGDRTPGTVFPCWKCSTVLRAPAGTKVTSNANKLTDRQKVWAGVIGGILVLVIIGFVSAPGQDPPTVTKTDWQLWAATNQATFTRGVQEFTSLPAGATDADVISHLRRGLAYYRLIGPLPDSEGQALFDEVVSHLERALTAAEARELASARDELVVAAAAENLFGNYLSTKV